jgi:hypothetical protein
MHEEINEHPIRHNEFTIGDLRTVDGMAANVDDMINRWQMLVDKIMASDETYIMEGCFIHAIDRYFDKSVYSIAQTLEYFKKVSEILLKAGTLFVYLRSEDVKATLEHVYPIRGQLWKNLIMMPIEKCFHIHEYKGEETIYESFDLYQEISDEVYNKYSGEKLLIETSVGAWGNSLQQILKHIGLIIIEAPVIDVQNLKMFCGKYSTACDSESIIEVKYDETHNNLYVVGFWSYMRLVPIASNAFVIESFPITLTFLKINSDTKIYVTGEYDWSIVGSILTKIK